MSSGVQTSLCLQSQAPDKALAKVVQMACIERRLLLTCGSYENVIRWIPPLVVDAQQIDEVLTTFEAALTAVSRA